ncbi:MAG: 30S ribosomal protein S16 [Candidatus Pacebacteria bacterium GW2011_GWB1_47_8]|nr:MAG: 30S ribosomal protein S16 [Candidatus Pacebacteria bacterium GW2011_GWA1_46_10]KKU84609.1 MAG: 30S ribosomal protein S16 [Candidatus Pacebacteria bacterium GW2011_GWB1_47_8]HCR81390.1 30S ribosomal protein S16 [Candidatus Paceibacterota bacterium]
MLKIKLARFGKRNQPHYRIVVNKARDKRDGAYVSQVGHYSPAELPKVLVIDVRAYQDWLKKGAQPTETVAALFKRFQSGNPFPEKKPQLSRKAKAKLAKPKEEPKAEPKENKQETTPVVDQPVEKSAEATPTTEQLAETPAETTPTTEPSTEKPIEEKLAEETPAKSPAPSPSKKEN